MRPHVKKPLSRSVNSSLRLEQLESRFLLSAHPGISHQMISSENTRNDIIGDTFTTAATLTLDASGDSTAQSSIDSRKDKDMFVFVANESGLVQIDLKALDTNLDTYLYVYNSRGKLVARDDDSGSGTDALVLIQVTAGESYYVRADAFRSSTGDYTLSIDGPSTGEAYADDYGDNFEDATLIEVDDYGNAIIVGLIGHIGDQDLFVYTATTDGQLQIDMKAADSPLDAYLYVYDSSGRLIARNDDSAKGTFDSQIIIEVVAGEQYFIQADAWHKSIGAYELTLTGPVPESETTESVAPDEPDITLEPDGSTDIIDTELSGDGQVEGWAVLVSAIDYPGSQNDLASSQVNLDQMYQTLIDVYGFSSDSIHTLSGDGTVVNSTAINTEIVWLATQADGNDLVIFYYSGHGSYGASYQRDDNEALSLPSGESYSETQLATQLNEINSEANKVVILDACFSGGFTSLCSRVSQTWVLASSAYNQYSWDTVSQFMPEGETGSVFTSWLVTAMNDTGSLNVDIDQNGRVSLAEAFNYADRMINRLTGFGYNNQNPVMSPGNVDLDLILLSQSIGMT